MVDRRTTSSAEIRDQFVDVDLTSSAAADFVLLYIRSQVRVGPSPHYSALETSTIASGVRSNVMLVQSR